MVAAPIYFKEPSGDTIDPAAISGFGAFLTAGVAESILQATKVTKTLGIMVLEGVTAGAVSNPISAGLDVEFNGNDAVIRYQNQNLYSFTVGALTTTAVAEILTATFLALGPALGLTITLLPELLIGMAVAGAISYVYSVLFSTTVDQFFDAFNGTEDRDVILVDESGSKHLFHAYYADGFGANATSTEERQAINNLIAIARNNNVTISNGMGFDIYSAFNNQTKEQLATYKLFDVSLVAKLANFFGVLDSNLLGMGGFNDAEGSVVTNSILLTSLNDFLLAKNTDLFYAPVNGISRLTEHPPVGFKLEDILVGSENGESLGSIAATDTAQLIIGLGGNDTIRGGATDDFLYGGDGEDEFRIIGAENVHVAIDGGADRDTVDFYLLATDAAKGLNITIANPLDGSVTSASGFSASLVSIENIIGSQGNDKITGNDEGNSIDGKGGDDTLIGGLGNDNLFGGDGFDIVDYQYANNAITVDLTPGVGLGTLVTVGENDVDLVGDDVEGIIGTVYDDTITGNAVANKLDGGAGSDHLYGAGGRDTLIGGYGDDYLDGGDDGDSLEGGSGNDTLIGGSGLDSYNFTTSGFGKDVIIDNEGRIIFNGMQLFGIASLTDQEDTYLLQKDGIDYVLRLVNDRKDLQIALNSDPNPVDSVTIKDFQSGTFGITLQSWIGDEVVIDTGYSRPNSISGFSNGNVLVSEKAFDAEGNLVQAYNIGLTYKQIIQTSTLVDDGVVVATIGYVPFQSPHTVSAQIFNTDGTARTGVLTLDSYPSGLGGGLTVTGLKGGGFVAVWQFNYSLVGKAFNSSGQLVNSFGVATRSGSTYETSPATAALTNGGFAVAWEENFDPQTGTNRSGGIYALVYDRNGVVKGTRIKVATTPGDFHLEIGPSVTALANGRFAVAWYSFEPGATTGVNGFVQVLDSNGNLVGDGYQLVTRAKNTNTAPSIIPLDDGRFVVTWSDEEFTATGIQHYNLKAQLFSSNGNPLSDPFQVNQNYASYANAYFVAGTSLPDGSLAITWQKNYPDPDVRLKIYKPVDIETGPMVVDDTLLGSESDDMVIGNDKDQLILGFAGADNLSGLGGSDSIFGGEGFDTLNGGTGNDSLYGDNGNDSIFGDEGDDLILGGAGDDFLEGGDGSDVIYGGAGNDYIEGDSGSGNDQLFGDEGDDTLVGNAGNDRLEGGSGNDLLSGGEGSDQFVFKLDVGAQDIITDFNPDLFGDRIDLSDSSLAHLKIFKDLIITQQGTDTLINLGNDQTILLKDLNANTITFNNFIGIKPGPLEITGTENDDFLQGAEDNDRIDGLGGNDQIVGNAGNDSLFGGAGMDTIFGDDQPFDPFGGPGFVGDDLLDGGDGDDYLLGGGGNDLLLGGQGNDELHGDGVNLFTSPFGNDVLNGGKGNDTLYGGLGDDRFVFTKDAGAIDEITDFNVPFATDNDKIDLSGSSFPNLQSFADLLITEEIVELFPGFTQTNSIIDLGDGQTIRLDNVSASSLSEANFIFGFTPANSDPVLATPIADQTAAEDSAFNFTVPAATFTDSDEGDELSYSATVADGNPLPAWLSFDAATRTFSGIPTAGDVGTLSLKVTATDLGGLFASDVFDIAIAHVNHAPTVSAAIANQSVQQDAVLSFALPTGTFTDVDAGDTLQLTATLANGDPMPSWLAFNADTQTFSGTPTNADVGDMQIMVTATDMDGLAVSSSFGLTVVNVNDAPTVNQALSNLSVNQDAAFNFTVPTNTFVDIDAAYGDTLTYSATLADGSSLPAWLSFNTDTQTFSGTPTNDDVGDLAVNVIATDAAGLAATSTFGLTVVNVNDAPIVSQPIANQDAEEGKAFVFQVPDNTFKDIDVGDTLSFSAMRADGTVLPAWLTFDAATLTFTGMPSNEDFGTTQFKVIASDNDGLTAEVAFDITVGLHVINGTAAAETLNGTRYDDHILGLAGNDILNGDAGNDLLDGGIGADTMRGGIGNDTYFVDNTKDVVQENSDEGLDWVKSTISYKLGSNVENLTLLGSSAINGTGNALDNVLIGNGGNNILTGGAGDDTLDGAAGADTLVGGAGDDTYVVDNVGDVVTEKRNAGIDTVHTTINYTLGDNVENLTLIGTAAINGTGNALNNRLTGNDAANRLAGGTGNDTYIISSGDTVVEALNAGFDTEFSDVSHTLEANVEALFLTGTDNINATGNDLNNVLVGNSADNVLDGGAGSNLMMGLDGDDTYIVDNVFDVVFEFSNGGTDTVVSSRTYTLGAHVENLTLSGNDEVNGIGNALDNIIVGNAGRNTLQGGVGADTLVGGMGSDVYQFNRGDGSDTIREDDNTVGNQDELVLGDGIAADQLWFRQIGADLEVSIIGSNDKSTISNWYSGSAYHIERFKTSNGQVLLDSQVDALTSAMAAFAPPAAGQTTLPPDYQAALNTVIAANWN